MEREYRSIIVFDEETEIIDADKWSNYLNAGYSNDDGNGYWVKKIGDSYFESRDEVFSTERKDATHIIWYSK